MQLSLMRWFWNIILAAAAILLLTACLAVALLWYRGKTMSIGDTYILRHTSDGPPIGAMPIGAA